MVSCVTVVYPSLTVGLAVPAELSTNLFFVCLVLKKVDTKVNKI